MSPAVEFSVRVEPAADAFRVTVRGELDLLAQDRLLSTVCEGIERDTSRVVMDLTGVSFIDSSGLRALLAIRRLAEQQGFSLSLLVKEGPVTRLLEVAGVKDWFCYG